MYKNKKPKNIIVEHKSDLNVTLKNTCQFAQRIKFTCLDVSLNYIVFGATSGGLYIFKRYPHVLIKLIPNKHGAVSLLAISPNEKSVVLTTSRSVIVLITNCFTSSDFQYHTYSEDKTNIITAIKWKDDDELYYGSNLGKVAVITVPNLLTKAIFQTPCSLLMQLDSSVCQIDYYSSLLLISTLTRTYLCNTEKEQFVQIGKKLRNGKFGACFFVDGEADRNIDSEQIGSNFNDSAKVFCNRPGARVWEAHLDATVTCTHQLKDFFKQKIDSWICLESNADPHVNIIRLSEQKPESQESLNFTKMLVLEEKFILTFNNEGFYIFDPETLTVIYRYNNFNTIIDVKVIKNFIYVCLKSMDVYIFGLYSLENIILKTLFNQQYHACLEICINYYKEVLDLVKTSDRIYLLTVLESKLCKCFATDSINNSLKLIFDALQNLSKKPFSEKLNNGIVLVNNTYINENGIHDAASSETSKETSDEDACNTDQLAIQSSDEDLKILLQQYDWSRINTKVKISKYKNLLDINNHNKIAVLFENFNQFMLEKDVDVKSWSYNSYLKYFANLDYEQLIERNEVNDNCIQFLVTSYCWINYSPTSKCVCSYPLPSASIKKPQFYNIGCVLLKRLKRCNITSCKQLLNDVPFMWKYIIEHVRNRDKIESLLPLLLQFNDEDLFKVFLHKFKYDTWDNAIKILIKLQQKKCINCEVEFDENCVVIKWTQLASYMIQSIGALSTVTLLKRYALFISSEDLDAKFYQSCIFAAAFDNLKLQSINQPSPMSQAMENDTFQLDEFIAKFLNDKYTAVSHTHCVNGMSCIKGQL